jgi:hypothetical protein
MLWLSNVREEIAYPLSRLQRRLTMNQKLPGASSLAEQVKSQAEFARSSGLRMLKQAFFLDDVRQLAFEIHGGWGQLLTLVELDGAVG